MAGDTISNTISTEVFLGSGVYLSPLTITATGRIAAPAPDTGFQAAAALYANVGNGIISNYGVISGAIPATDSYSSPAIFSTNPLNLTNHGTITGQSGIYFADGGIIVNSGTISGTDARTAGGYGVHLAGAELINSNFVYGKSYGAAGSNASTVSNSGTITGVTAGVKLLAANAAAADTLVNTGTIRGTVSGITSSSALITNSGIITGQTYGLRSSFGGTVGNSGRISAAVDGVLLLNEQYQAKYATTLTNTGTLQGGYFGLALNFADATNAASGLISGTTFGAGIGDVGYLFNAGSIYGAAGGLLIESGGRAVNAHQVRSNNIGVELFSNGIFTNVSTGTIYAPGTAGLDPDGYLLNAGRMSAVAYGLELLSGGIAVNSGAIISSQDGVYLSSISSTSSRDLLANTGYIYSTELGVNLRNGTAYNTGTIHSDQIAVSMVTSTSLNNSGYIYGVRYGVQLLGGTLLNTGSIGGKVDGIRLTGGDLTELGKVSGAKYAIYGTSFSLTIDPGAVFTGNVVDKSKTSTLELAGSTPGTLSGLGTQFNGFNKIDFASGAHWVLSGTSAALVLGQVITGFEQGDTIVVSGKSITNEFFVVNQGLRLYAGSNFDVLDLVGSFTTPNFSVTTSGTITTIKLLPNAPCFVAGTRILTPRGEVAVEDLLLGEPVITQSGEDEPIIWIGKRTIDLRLHPQPAVAQPVCISAGSLSENVPRRDLWVSPDHALWIDDLLVPAQLLLNGVNIYQGALEKVTYYHLELKRHAVVYAENAPAETYLETGNRNAFENTGGEMTLHPDFSAMLRRENSCAALLLEGEKLGEIRGKTLRKKFFF
jgi:hypothetical protein